MDDRARSPLAHRAPLAAGAALRLEERRGIGFAILRGEPEVVADPVAAATGLALPHACRATARAGELAALWLAPDEWLLATADADAAAALAGRIATALADRHHQVVDVSDFYAALELSGPELRGCLAKLVALDLHPRAWRRDEVLATHLAKAMVQLWLVADEAEDSGPRARIVVRRSMADYVWCLVADAARAWGMPDETPIGRVRLEVADATPPHG